MTSPAESRQTIAVRGASVRFGGLQALSDVSIELRPGEVTALIGPNGAGKTTFINCLTGIVPMTAGQVLIGGTVVEPPRPDNLIELGFARTFQNIRLFPNLTVREQVEMARIGLRGSHRARRQAAAGQADGETPDGLLTRLGLSHRGQETPSNLSYGEQRRLEIARALATRPRLLLLDEPAAGMVPSEQMALAEIISDIASRGVAVMLVEHHMDLVARVASEVVVLNFGRQIAAGSIGEVRADPEVISAYLGSTGRA
jgi:branched-chain amino acid transport system ATP-binding protein